MENQSVEQFDRDMQRIIALLEKDETREARSIFNCEIFPKYGKIRGTDTRNPLSRLALFFFDLDEFLNNSAARSFGVASREGIIRSFHSDYQEDLKEARTQEQMATAQGLDI